MAKIIQTYFYYECDPIIFYRWAENVYLGQNKELRSLYRFV